MIRATFITPAGLARFEAIAGHAAAGLSLAEAAARLGLENGHLTGTIARLTGDYRWPRGGFSPAVLAHVRGLPVRLGRPLAARGCAAPKPCAAQIHAMREAAAAARAAHEQTWLRREAERYRLPRVGRALSSMVI